MDVLILVLKLLGSLGVFLYGMKIMSDALQKLAGDSLRGFLSKMTSNRFSGVLTGMGITSIIQSSSATTVMVVSFVNAGALSLAGAISVIMGANIGTTVTAWLVSLLGFKFSISDCVLPIIAIATPLLFIKKQQNLGEFLIGFALLFLGLQFLTNGVPDFTKPEYAGVLEYIASLSNYGYFSTLLFVLIGTILTCVVQSSSAMMAVTLVMCSKGLIGFEVGAALVLGENIGTTITANLAAVVANKTAKKAARAHFIFNVIGVIWILCLFNPILTLISKISLMTEGVNPLVNSTAIPIALSIFHSFFNITNTMLLVWFIPQIIKIVNKMIPTKEDEEDDFRLQYLPLGMLSAGELSLEPAKKEIEIFSKRVLRMYEMLPGLLKIKDDKKYKEVYERICKYEEITDRMEIEIASYLTKVSESELSHSASMQVSSMLRIVDNLESIGDSCFQIALTIDNKNKSNIWFTQEMRDKLNKMYEYVHEAIALMNENLNNNYSQVSSLEAEEIEYKINLYRDQLRTEHTESIKNNEYSYQTGIYYSSLYAQYEKLADFAINITEAIEKTHD